MTLLVLVLGLGLAAALRVSSFAGLALSLGLAWIAIELALRTRLAPRVKAIAQDRRELLVLCAIVPVLVLGAQGARLAEAEGLLELAPRLGDRLRLAPSVSIAPPLVVAHGPQTFFVRADGAGEVRVSFESAEIAAQSLGHGVFRVDLDPGVEGLGARETGTITATIAVDGALHMRTLAFVAPAPHPRAPALTDDAQVACLVSEETDEVHIGPPGALRAVHVAGGPVACALDGDEVWIATRTGTHLQTLGAPFGSGGYADLARFERSEGPEIGAGAVAMAWRDGWLAIVRAAEVRELVIVQSDDHRVHGRVPLEGVPVAVALTGAERAEVVVGTRSPSRLEVFSLDRRGSDERAPSDRRRALAMPAVAIALAPDDAAIVIATTAFDERARDNLGNHFVEDQLVWLDGRSLAPLRAVPTARRTPRQDHAGDADRGLSPYALAFDDAGALLVAFAGSSELGVFTDTAPPRYLELSEHLFGPTGLAVAGSRALVSSAIDGTVLTLERRALSLAHTEHLAPTQEALLVDAPELLRIRLGERTFWEGTRSGASCQSCHLGGANDGQAHNIGGRVLAPTLDVRGLAGTAPFLRDGSYPHLGDLHDVAVLEYRGYRAPAGDRRATLDAYLRAQPLPPSLAPRDVVREQGGLDAFFRAGCDRCHAPPAFTSLARHALRTVFPDVEDDPALSLDVPALRNLRDQAPYLYDGRAATLRDVLTTANAANRHGDTASLSDAQRGDLLFFLETL